MRQTLAFTLLELLITIAILATLTAMAAPPLGRLIADQQLSAQANGWLSLALYARQEAMRQGQPMQLCQWLEDRCVTDSRTPWSVLPVSAGNESEILRSLPLHNPAIQQHSNRLRYVFQPRGNATNGSFTLCDPRGRADARQVVLNLAGRPRVQRRETFGNCP